jgi:hypothetical protein
MPKSPESKAVVVSSTSLGSGSCLGRTGGFHFKVKEKINAELATINRRNQSFATEYSNLRSK